MDWLIEFNVDDFNVKYWLVSQQGPNMSSHGLWVERYRPQDLSTYVGNEHLKTK